MLHRAGIVNVYQYAEETLRFGGGRLLLRGVNGSGKSTAMNMLLPFLLDANVRRIDAAGEQTGVLRSWMLSGRDEVQPTGYLWLELERAGDPEVDGGTTAPEHLVFGCGIKANRNTDSVNHWWFVTNRRPGIDLELVRPVGGNARAPLSAEQLRTEIGSECVWTKEQRAGYRTELHGRLFGGADIDQHLDLLHVVRNPRVGDRIDVDLPRHLHDALPQLSDAAIDDAATPLEKLEEHRRNVGQLTNTVRTLDAIAATYRQHARSELRGRATDGGAAAAEHRRRVQAVRIATDGLAAIDEHLAAAAAEQAAQREAIVRHRGEIENLYASTAYQSLGQLDDRRSEVARLGRAVGEAERLLDEARQLVVEHRDRVDRRRADARETLVRAERATTDLRAGADDGRVGAAAAALVAPSFVSTSREVGAPSGDGQQVEVPDGGVDTSATRAAALQIRSAGQLRAGDLAAVIEALDRADAAAEQAHLAAREATAAAERREAAADVEHRAREALRDLATAWRSDAEVWVARAADLRTRHGIDEGAPPLPDPSSVDVVAGHDTLAQAFASVVEASRRVQQVADAALVARLDREVELVAEATAVVTDLSTRELPEPPSTPWQADRRGPSFGELLDFTPSVSDADRAGLEAALEASGLLAAEVRADGLVAASGELLAVPSTVVEPSLADLLVPTVPDHIPLDPATVAGLLGSVSTDPADLDRAGGPTTVTVDGRFRSGVLTGRHRKPAAEHVGVTARRAMLDRLRAEAATALAEAEAAVERSRADRQQVAVRLAEVEDLWATVPDGRALVAAQIRVESSAADLALAVERHDAAVDAQERADRVHAELADAARRTCAELDLPHDRPALAAVGDALRSLPALADAVDRTLAELERSVSGWSEAVDDLTAAANRADAAATRAEDRGREHRTARSDLATLEDAVGADAKLVQDGIDDAKAALAAAEQGSEAAQRSITSLTGDRGKAVEAADHARDAAARAERTAVDALTGLRRVLAVPGLVDAAVEPSTVEVSAEVEPADPVVPTVEDSPAGLRALCRALLDQVPEAPPTPADSVRNALRQRRDSLGAGWDAQDHQPDPSLPLSVEVIGPLGTMPLAAAAARAADELGRATGLLTAQQDQALRNLLNGLIAEEVARKLHAAEELVTGMNARLGQVRTTHGIGVSLRWKRRDDLDDDLREMVKLLARRPDLRSGEQDGRLVEALSRRIEEARAADPEASYASLVGRVFDYRDWHRMQVLVHRTGDEPVVLGRRTGLSEGEKKLVSYQPLFAAVAASCDALAERAPDAPRFVLLDDAFAKVSEDNHAKLFGLLVDLDLDVIATSERLRGTHATVPELAITEVVRDADAGVIVLEHSHWNGTTLVEGS